MIHENGSLQIIDFGVAGMLETKADKRTTIIGTLHWMGPELLRGHNQPDGKKLHGKEVSNAPHSHISWSFHGWLSDRFVRLIHGPTAVPCMKWPQVNLLTLVYRRPPWTSIYVK